MKHLTDQQLLSAIEKLVGRERELLNEVLNHLREIDRRKLFSSLGFTSLFDYATKHLKYSPDQAGRRIAAMRVLRDIPEAQAKVIDGSLTLSSLAQAHWHFNKVQYSKDEKREVLTKLENATKKQTQAILKKDESVRYSFVTDEAGEKMIEQLRGLNPHLTFDQLMIKICEMALDKIDPQKKIERAELRANKKQTAESEVKLEVQSMAAPNAQFFTSAGKVTSDRQASAQRRYIPAEVKRHVWSKAGGRCESCNSTFALEYDHIVPFAMGGASTRENLRLLCRSCSQRKGIEAYGLKKMEMRNCLAERAQ